MPVAATAPTRKKSSTQSARAPHIQLITPQRKQALGHATCVEALAPARRWPAS